VTTVDGTLVSAVRSVLITRVNSPPFCQSFHAVTFENRPHFSRLVCALKSSLK
jgi:hypothetical protein